MNLNRRYFTALVFWVACVAPAKTQFVDFRSNLYIEPIEIEKQSPAYMAFEDLQASYDYELASEASLALAPTTETAILNNTSEVARVGRELTELIQKRVFASHVVLNTLVISAAPTEKQTEQQARQIQKPDNLAKLIQEYNRDNEPLTVMGLAEVLVAEELARRSDGETPNTKKIETQSGEPITVTKPGYVVANNMYATDAGGDNGVKLNRSKDPPSRYLLRGPITFAGGAALLGHGDEIVARQIMDGLVVNKGYVNVNEARYEVEIAEIAGEVQVSVQSRDGTVRALGQLNLYDLSRTVEQKVLQARTQARRIDGQEITVRPVASGVSGSVISAASYGRTVFNLADARVHIADLDRQILRNKNTKLYEDLDVAIPSSALIKAQQPNFWPALAFAESGTKFQLRLFPTSLVEALFGLTLEKHEAREAKNKGIIWGRVTYGGRPIEGVKVDIVGEKKIKPVYFNGILPDKTKTTTTERGEFAFTQLEDAEEMIRVSLGSKIFWPVMSPVEKGFVYYADLEIEPTRTIELKSYDAFSASPLAALVQPLGTQEEMTIPNHGATRVTVDTVRGLSFIEAQADESHMPTRVALRTKQIEVNFAHVKRAWLDEMRKKSGLIQGALSTAVVGFVEGEDYDVLVGATSGANQNRSIVYFDNKGQILERSLEKNNSGVSGGGFIVFDLPRGIHTLTIIPAQTKKIITQTVYADEFATHLLQLNLAN